MFGIFGKGHECGHSRICFFFQTIEGYTMPYGYELILDLHGCDVSSFTRESLKQYFETICSAIDMVPEELYFWDDVGVPEEERQHLPHTKGTSAVQFILTSSIVVHTLDLLGSVYVNIFSCKAFDNKIAKEVTEKWFKSTTCRCNSVERSAE